MKYSIVTFGCRVNQADSLEFDESLRARGATEVPPEQADLVIVNTCTVTGAADQGARRVIRRIARANSRVRIAVTGCYAARTPGDLARLPNVVRIVSNDDKSCLVRLLDEEFPFPGAERSCFGEGGYRGIEPGAMGRTAYPLRVQTGCSEACAFCVVPSTRGASRSRPPAEVLAEVERLAAAGYREIWLVGVHLGSYGRDLPVPASLGGLLRALEGVGGDVTFRIGSIEPMDCSRDLVDLVASSGRFAPHFHLPLQQGTDRLLAAMRRPYTFARYRDLVEYVRTCLPHASIGSDLIAGFPGESEGEAEASADAVAGLPLSYLHVFPYSDRPGTEAAAMTTKVASADVRRRTARLREIGAQLAARFVRSQVGTVRQGLTLDDGRTVLTDNFLKVSIPPGLERNVRVRVRIEDETHPIAGRLV